MDFGLAIPRSTKQVGEPDRRGTKGFRAPEVLRGSLKQTQGFSLLFPKVWKFVDSTLLAIDMWSAGMLLLTLICRNNIDIRISRPRNDFEAQKALEEFFGPEWATEPPNVFAPRFCELSKVCILSEDFLADHSSRPGRCSSWREFILA